MRYPLGPFDYFTELEYTNKLTKLAQTTRAAITEEVRVVTFNKWIL